MTQPLGEPIGETRCILYESRRLLKWSWRFKFVAANNQILGHQYNELRDALIAINHIANPHMPLRLIVVYRDGTIEDRGLAHYDYHR